MINSEASFLQKALLVTLLLALEVYNFTQRDGSDHVSQAYSIHH